METKSTELVEDEMCEINPNNFTTIDALPTESLTHILQFLSPIERIRSEQVCKKWRDASRQTWRDVEALYILDPKFHEYHKFEDGAELYGLVEKELNQLFVGTNSPKIIRCLISRVGCFINKLIFDYSASEYEQVIYSIINCYCRNLKVLFLGDNYKLGVNKQLLSMLFECNQELHSVHCGYVKNCIELLPFRDWRSLRFGITKGCHEGKIVSLIEYSEGLEEFKCNRYTTRIVKALLKLPNLKSLYFDSVYDEPLLNMITHVPLLNQLRNLVLENCLFDSDARMLSNLLQHCCQLERLTIYYRGLEIFPMILLEVILTLPNLKTLTIASNAINNDALIHLTKFRNLQLLIWIESSASNGILQMIKKSEFLENLDIGLAEVTPKIFRQLVREMKNRQKYLNINVSRRIFDEVSEICAGSKIRVVEDSLQCFRDYEI